MDELLEETWGTGFFQKRSLFLNTITIVPLQGLYFHNLFFGQELGHTCDENNHLVEKYSSNETGGFNSTCLEECSMSTSYANDFGLLCENASQRTTLLSYFLFCTSIGVFLNGPVYDYFGRRKSAIFYGLMSMLSYFGLVTSYSVLQFKICSCVLGLCCPGIGSYPSMFELSKKSWKWVIGLYTSAMWTVSILWLTLVTYFIRDWQLAFKIYSSPMLFAILYIFYYPESPRWLLEQGRTVEAIDWLRHIAKTNGVQIELSDIAEKVSQLKEDRVSANEIERPDTVVDYLKRFQVSGRLCILIWIHSCAMLLWYNIVFATGTMNCCIYVTFAVMVLLEGPLRMSYNALLLKRIRRKGIAFFISASSICFIILITLQRYEKADEFWIPKLVFGVVSKLMVQSYMTYMFTIVSEVSPTFFRARAMSALLAFGNLSSTCAPLILSVIGTNTPAFALLALLSVNLIFFLPAVIKADLPNNLDDAERLALTANKLFERKTCI